MSVEDEDTNLYFLWHVHIHHLYDNILVKLLLSLTTLSMQQNEN